MHVLAYTDRMTSYSLLRWFRGRRRQRHGARLLAANVFALWAVMALNPCFTASAQTARAMPQSSPQAMSASMPDCPQAAAMVAPDCDVWANLECELPEPFAANLAPLASDAAPAFIPIVLHLSAPPVAPRLFHSAPTAESSPPAAYAVCARLRHCVFLI